MAATDTDSDFEPETEALEIVMEDLHDAYAAIVQHLDKAVKGLKEMGEQKRAAAARETELVAALDRARASANFGATLLQELEKFEQTGRAKEADTSTTIHKNGNTESIATSSD